MRGGTVRKSVPKCRNSSRRLSAGACHVRGFAPNTAILLRRDFVQPGAVRWNVERESAGDFAGVAFLPEVAQRAGFGRSEEHTSELQSLRHLVCRLLLEKKKT